MLTTTYLLGSDSKFTKPFRSFSLEDSPIVTMRAVKATNEVTMKVKGEVRKAEKAEDRSHNNMAT
jgi:hypothetical protein